MKFDWQEHKDAVIKFIEDDFSNSLYHWTTNSIERKEEPVLTIESMLKTVNDFVEKYPPLPKVYYTVNALKENREVRNFPFSKHRSARIRKKLIKRFGSEFVMEPVILKIGKDIYAHPSFKAAIASRING